MPEAEWLCWSHDRGDVGEGWSGKGVFQRSQSLLLAFSSVPGNLPLQAAPSKWGSTKVGDCAEVYT